MTRLLAFSAFTFLAALAAGAPADAPEKAVGVLAVDVRGVSPQLGRRLHAAVFAALQAERALPRDLTQSHAALAACRSLPECLGGALRRRQLDYVLFAKVAPTPAATPAAPEHELTVRLGRMPRGLSVWGPWPATTLCTDCSDSELVTKLERLIARGLTAMRVAELSAKGLAATPRDRRDKGRTLLRQALDEQLPVPYQIHLLERALGAGAGGPALAALARIFFACGGYEEAESYATRAASQGQPTDAILAPTLWFSGRWAEAQTVLARLVLAAPNDEQWAKALGEVSLRVRDGRSVLEQAEVELKHGDPEKAVLLARIALASGRGTRARLLLGRASLVTSAYADAWAQFVAVLEDEPTHAEALAGKQKAEAALSSATPTGPM